jgi:hypothetical protein
MEGKAHAINRLVKAVDSCKNFIPNIEFRTEREDVTTDYFPEEQSNSKLIICIVTPIKNGSQT